MKLDTLFDVGVIGSFLLDKVWPLVSNFAAKEGRKAVNARMERTSEEKRAELVALFTKHLELSQINPETGEIAREEFLRRQELRQHLGKRTYGSNEPYKPGDEEVLMHVLVSIYEALKDDHELADRVAMFRWMFTELEDEQFDAVIDALVNDQVLQWFLRVLRLSRDAFRAVATRIQSYPAYQDVRDFLEPQNLKRIAKEGLRIAGETDEEVAERIQDMRQNYPSWMMRHDRPKKGPLRDFFGF